MKTAKEWAEDKMVFLTTEDCIKAIQQDAYRAGLLRAAELCRDVPTIWTGVTDCIKAIEAEAQKGQP